MQLHPHVPRVVPPPPPPPPPRLHDEDAEWPARWTKDGDDTPVMEVGAGDETPKMEAGDDAGEITEEAESSEHEPATEPPKVESDDYMAFEPGSRGQGTKRGLAE